MMKRLIALALVLTMAISMVPVTAGAENEGTAVSNDVTLEGTSSFGNLLTNTVNESQQEGSVEAYDARICDLVIEGATATVEYTTPVEANLVVAIYDQNSGKMLGSGTVAVSPEETIAEVAIEIPVIPIRFPTMGKNTKRTSPYTERQRLWRSFWAQHNRAQETLSILEPMERF